MSHEIRKELTGAKKTLKEAPVEGIADALSTQGTKYIADQLGLLVSRLEGTRITVQEGQQKADTVGEKSEEAANQLRTILEGSANPLASRTYKRAETMHTENVTVQGHLDGMDMRLREAAELLLQAREKLGEYDTHAKSALESLDSVLAVQGFAVDAIDTYVREAL